MQSLISSVRPTNRFWFADYIRRKADFRVNCHVATPIDLRRSTYFGHAADGRLDGLLCQIARAGLGVVFHPVTGGRYGAADVICSVSRPTDATERLLSKRDSPLCA